MAQGDNRKVTLKDVSKASGLSLITVSRALRQPETVHADTRAKIQRTIDEIGYIPNLTARSLVSQRSDMIGVVVPILASSLFADFAQGVSHVLEPKKQQMLLAVSDWSPQKEEEAVRTFIARQADAIIVTGFSHSAATTKLLGKFSGPVIEAWNLRDAHMAETLAHVLEARGPGAKAGVATYVSDIPDTKRTSPVEMLSAVVPV